jgi:hypothetical protein
LPVKKKDPEKLRQAFEDFDRALDRAIAPGTTREEILDMLDLSKPFPYDE